MIISDQRARKVTISQMMSCFEYDFNVLFCFFGGEGGYHFFPLHLSKHCTYKLYKKNDLLHMLNVVHHVQVYM